VPKAAGHTVFTPKPLLECEAKLQYTMQPWSYEIFKLILVDDMVDERPNYDETAD